MSVSADRAVSMTIGVVFERARSSRQTSKPFFFGSMTSRMTRSGSKLRGACQPLVAVGRRLHFVAFELEVVTQTEQHLRFVLDHQNALHDGLPPRWRPRGWGSAA